MKTKFLYCFSFIILFSLKLQAQLENEIKSFVDSTEVLVNNGRKMLTQKIMDGDYAKARDIYHYLKDRTKDEKFAAFYYSEELYLDFLISDWTEWIKKAEGFTQYSKPVCYQSIPEINGLLYAEISKKGDFFESLIPTLDLDVEARRVMAVYIYFLRVGIRDEQYSKLLKSFHKDYPSSRFNDFLDKYMPKALVKGAWSWTLGTAGFFPTGELAERFSSKMGFGMAMDVNFGKIYGSLSMDAGGVDLKTPFSASAKGVDWDFTKGEQFRYLQGSLLMGYFVTRNNRYHLAPFVSIGGAELTSNRFESDDDEKEFKLINSFLCGPGLHTEIKLKQFHIDNEYRYGGSALSYISLKLDGGYHFLTEKRIAGFKGNMAYFKFGLVWGIGIF